MKLKITCLIIIGCCTFFITSKLQAQKTRWPIGIEGSLAGIGVPSTMEYGFNLNSITCIKERKQGKKISKKAKPAEIHLLYEAFDASQVVITETYNPGAISKVEIGYHPERNREIIRKTIWEGEVSTTVAKYRVRNLHFELTPNITDVWITVNYAEVAGVNQIGGVGLVNSADDYFPHINLPKKEIYSRNVKRLNDDVNGEKNPKGLIISADGRYVYFSNEERDYEKIYRGEFNSEKEIVKVTFSDFNLPDYKSRISGLIGISQDNNVAFVSDMLLNKFHFYNTFLGKSITGKPKWRYESKEIKNYKNGGIYLDYVMSYDGNILIIGYKEKSDYGEKYKEDLYFSLKDSTGNWSPFKNMGFDLNTLGSEAPCFLASDNKTLYFVSTGMIGFGEGDIFVSKLMDDSWTNWSEPINLGPNINSHGHENSFTIDPLSKKVFFIRWENNELSNIYSIDIENLPVNISQAEKKVEKVISVQAEEKVEKVISVESKTLVEVEEEKTLPEPVIIVSGVTSNKKTGEPMQAEIVYNDIFTGAIIGKALSHAETGEYTIILRKGTFYSFEAKADNFIGESYSFNTTNLNNFGRITKDYKLSPIEKNETIRLNNIFFDTDKAELLPESFMELDKLIALLNQNIKIKIEIGGHTDDVASDSYNQKLSQLRAESVRNYLVSKGINTDRVLAKGYGENKPCVLNDSPENRAINRRVEFTILEIK